MLWRNMLGKCGVRVIEWEKSNIYIGKKVATQHMSNGRTATTSTYCCFNAAAKTSFSALIFSPFISFTLALVSPLNYKHTPMSSKRFTVCFTQGWKKSLMYNFGILLLNARFGARMHFYTSSLQIYVHTTSFLFYLNIIHYSHPCIHTSCCHTVSLKSYVLNRLVFYRTFYNPKLLTWYDMRFGIYDILSMMKLK